MMNGKQLYSIFKGIKLHFTSNAYDYLTYGPAKVSDGEFVKVYTLSNGLTRKFKEREDLERRLISVFKKKNIWINEIASPEAEKMEREHVGKLCNFYYEYETDISKFDDIIGSTKTFSKFEIPEIAKSYIKEEISLETFCALDNLLNFSYNIDDLVWRSYRLRIEKYKSFFNPDMKRIAKITRQQIDK